MNQKKIEQILRDTAYVRTGGTGEELRTAEYLQARCRELVQASPDLFATSSI